MSDSARAALRGVGEVLITLGVLLLLYVVWALWFTGIGTAREQESLYSGLNEQWETTSPNPSIPVEDVALGDGIAVLRIPLFGPDYHPVILQGTSRAVLKNGPGHYVDTALPGAIGNFAVAGHRTTHGAPFNRIDELTPGSPIVVETADTYYTYRVTSQKVVKPTDTAVVLPVPEQPGIAPTEAVMTMTTCHPEYSSRQRLIVWSRLEAATPKSQGPPAVLTDPHEAVPGGATPTPAASEAS